MNRLEHIKGKTIYYAVLNWGLGHASRSSVIIQQLIHNNKIILFSSGNALNYLKQMFPNVNCINMNCPEITYPKGKSLWFSMLKQKSKFNTILKQEQKSVTMHIDSELESALIISDNCYGFYHCKVKSILLTHQLNIKSPFFQNYLQKKIRSLFYPFHEIWIPDFEGEKNLAGELSHPAFSKIPCHYINPISNYKSLAPTAIRFEYCAIISGPEKQRTIFENEVIRFFTNKKSPCLLIRGITENKKLELNIPSHITVINFAAGSTLIEMVNKSSIIICRSGYSSIMDLYSCQKKCILYPTPGQTEQEYLYRKHFKNTKSDFLNVNPIFISVC